MQQMNTWNCRPSNNFYTLSCDCLNSLDRHFRNSVGWILCDDQLLHVFPLYNLWLDTWNKWLLPSLIIIFSYSLLPGSNRLQSTEYQPQVPDFEQFTCKQYVNSILKLYLKRWWNKLSEHVCKQYHNGNSFNHVHSSLQLGSSPPVGVASGVCLWN